MIGVESRYFLGTRVDNLSLDAALERVETLIQESKEDQVPRQVFFSNVHSVHLARQDSEFQRTLDLADLVLPDGSGLKIAGEVLDMPVKENLNGTDFTPKVCRMAEVAGWSMYLLGAREHVVNRCCENLLERFPNLRLEGWHNGYFDEEEEQKIIEEINRIQPDILLVALGSPYQEKWIAAHADELDAHVCFAVGGLFDFLSNEMERAPKWMRDMGIEWAHRFMENPSAKWERIFIEIPLFLTLVMRQKILSDGPQVFNELRQIPNG